MAATNTPSILAQLQSLASGDRQQVAAFNRRLLEDHAFRDSFMTDPNEALARMGISVDKPITLAPRDLRLIQLMADARTTELYKAGDMPGLRKYIAAAYADLTNSPKRECADERSATEVVALIDLEFDVYAFVIGVSCREEGPSGRSES